MKSTEQLSSNSRVLTIAVARGKVTLDDLHKALDLAVRHLGGNCQCGMTGFDLKFVAVDPALKELTQIPNVQGGMVLHEAIQ